MLEWVLMGLVASALVITYWDRIKRWLDTIVADKIEKIFGYGAKQRVHHAVSIADRVAGGIRNRVFVYVRKKFGSGYDKYEEKECKVISEIEPEVVKEINEKGPIIQEFSYME